MVVRHYQVVLNETLYSQSHFQGHPLPIVLTQVLLACPPYNLTPEQAKQYISQFQI